MSSLVSDGSPTLPGSRLAVSPRIDAPNVYRSLNTDPPPRGVLARTRP